MGVFFKVEAVALYEDIEPALEGKACDTEGCKGPLENVEYYAQDDVTTAYSNAA